LRPRPARVIRPELRCQAASEPDFVELDVGCAARAPVDELLEQAVVGALIEQYSGDGEPDPDALALITSAPALQAEFLDAIAAIERSWLRRSRPVPAPRARASSGPRCLPAPFRGGLGRCRALASPRTGHQILGHAARRPHLDRPRPTLSRSMAAGGRIRSSPPRVGIHPGQQIAAAPERTARALAEVTAKGAARRRKRQDLGREDGKGYGERPAVYLGQLALEPDIRAEVPAGTSRGECPAGVAAVRRSTLFVSELWHPLADNHFRHAISG
jgi:hypothetical protein